MASRPKLPYLRMRHDHWWVWMRNPHGRGPKILKQSLRHADDVAAIKTSQALARFVREKWDTLRREEAFQLDAPAAQVYYRNCGPFDFSSLVAKRTIVDWPETDEHGRLLGQETIPIQEALQRARQIEQRNVELVDENRQLYAELTALRKQLADTPLGEGAKITVEQALAKWDRYVQTAIPSPRQRQEVARCSRVGAHAIRHQLLREVTSEAIRGSVEQSMKQRSKRKGALPPKSPGTYFRRLRECRRFLLWAADEWSLDGLRRAAKVLRITSPSTLARKTEKDTVDSAALAAFLLRTDPGLFRDARELVYWQALVAALCYGGFRLSELAGLRWSDVDTKAKLITVQDCEEKTLKTANSSRVVRGLAPLWDWLERLRPITGEKKLVFPVWFAVEELRDECWLALDPKSGAVSAWRLSDRLIRHRDAIGLGPKLALRSRRWCRTELLKSLPEHVVSAQLGHSSETGQAHYQKNRSIVLAFPAPPVAVAAQA